MRIIIYNQVVHESIMQVLTGFSDAFSPDSSFTTLLDTSVVDLRCYKHNFERNRFLLYYVLLE